MENKPIITVKRSLTYLQHRLFVGNDLKMYIAVNERGKALDHGFYKNDNEAKIKLGVDGHEGDSSEWLSARVGYANQYPNGFKVIFKKD